MNTPRHMGALRDYARAGRRRWLTPPKKKLKAETADDICVQGRPHWDGAGSANRLSAGAFTVKVTHTPVVCYLILQ